MDFGLWVEPEMVNPDSDLYRKHPEWVLNMPGRPRSEARNQLVLNLARPDVRAYVLSFLDKLLTENDIAFLKWDYNRNWSEPGWDQLPPTEQKKVYVEFTRNLYAILAELKRRHPKVELESCSGGGGRVDLGILKYADEVWPSDNTDPFDRLKEQDGFTYPYTAQVMMAWVTDSPHWLNKRSTSLTYRMLSSMQGSLGIGANISKWSDDETGDGEAADCQLSPGAADDCAGRPLQADLAAQWQRVLGHANRQPRQEPVGSLCVHPFDSGGKNVSETQTEGARSRCTVCGDVHRWETSAGIARGGQRRILDESRHGHERRFPRRFPGVGIPARQKVGSADGASAFL